MKSLNVAISSRWHDKFDAENFEHFPEIRDCFEIIRNNFPMKSEVVIADFPNEDEDDLTNLIEKEEGKNPKIVNIWSKNPKFPNLCSILKIIKSDRGKQLFLDKDRTKHQGATS